MEYHLLYNLLANIVSLQLHYTAKKGLLHKHQKSIS